MKREIQSFRWGIQLSCSFYPNFEEIGHWVSIGFITQSLEIAERKAKEGCEFVLSFDGKLIALGCKGESKGDANLWGLEGPPTLSQSLKVLKNTLSAAQKINVDMCHTEIPLHFMHLQELLHVSSRQIKRLHG